MSDFAHRLTLDRIRDGDRLDLVADAEERAAVAARLDLPSLERLDAHAVLRRDGDTVHASGRVKASLEQRCVATGDAASGADRRSLRPALHSRPDDRRRRRGVRA